MRQKVKITPQKLRKFYYRGNISARKTAIYFNCSPTTIKNYLDRYGWRVKRQGEVMRGRTLDTQHRDKVIRTLNNYISR